MSTEFSSTVDAHELPDAFYSGAYVPYQGDIDLTMAPSPEHTQREREREWSIARHVGAIAQPEEISNPDPETVSTTQTGDYPHPIGPERPLNGHILEIIVNDFEPQGNVAIVPVLEDRLFTEVFLPAENQAAERLIGGHGITKRSLEGIDSYLPGVRERLLTEQGKVVFLGNGYSQAPLEMLEQRGEVPAPEIVVVDAIDYPTLHLDLQRLRSSFEERLVEVPAALDNLLERCGNLLEGASAGRLRLVQHIVGQGEIPQEARNADVAINLYGPPTRTIRQQVDCLKPGGRLYIGDNNWRPGTAQRLGVHIQPLPQGRTTSGCVLTKL